eukprot:jgi/Hompol1/721/HPOL_005391-RA
MEFIPTSLISDLNKLNQPAKKPQASGAGGAKSAATVPKKASTRGKGFSTGSEPLPYPAPDAASNEQLSSLTEEDAANNTSISKPTAAANQPAQGNARITLPVVPDATYVHESAARRLSHLGSRSAVQDAGDLSHPSFQIIEPPLTYLVVVQGVDGTGPGDDSPSVFPALRPTTRKEVAMLKNAMIKLLRDIGADEDQEYPTEMHAFLAIIQEEQKIYDSVFQEIIRQVTVNMIERGEVIAEIRRRYANMFLKIPKHIKNLHTELVAQRKLNRRLSEELVRSKETVADLLRELDFVRKHDVEVTKQAQEAQEKLVSVLTQSDNTDEILEEYHKLYRMQRDRLEEAVRLSEQEKRIWVDAATSLAIRIGQEHGITDLVLLQKHEHGRLRATNHIVIIISETNDSELSGIEKKIEDWRTKLTKLSQSVVEEDHNNMEILSKMQRDMKMVLKNLTVNEPMDTIELDHPLLKVFHIFDVKSVADHLNRWVEQVGIVAVRFTSDRDLSVQEEISYIRKMAEIWIEAGLKLLRRNEKSTNGKDYLPLSDVLSKLAIEIEEWLTKLDLRVSGEDGIASQVISLQNQLEDRCAAYSARDMDKPFPSSERAQLKEALTHWTEHIGVLINTLSNTAEKEQHKIPLHVENWVSRLLDQMNTDTDIRNEDNMKLHTSMISWMVHLLVKGGKEKPSESWDHEFQLLNQELISFNINLMRDAADIEMLSDDKRELRKVVQELCDSWILVAKRLLAIEKKNAFKVRTDGEKKTEK